MKSSTSDLVLKFDLKIFSYGNHGGDYCMQGFFYEKIIIYVENLFATFLVIFVSTFSLYYFLILQFMVPRRKAHRKLSP